MPTDSANAAQHTPFVRRFHESVTLIEYDGRPIVVAREFGAMLDYSEDGKALVDLVAGEWSDEFLPDVDYIVLRNGRLAAFKRLCAQLHLDLVDKRAPSLLLLTESGIQLVLARTEKPEGKVFRRWLVSECIPAYQATRALPGPAPAPELAPPVVEAAESVVEPPRASDALRALRRLVERFHATGRLTGAVWEALDEALCAAEQVPPATGIDGIPVPEDRLEASIHDDARVALSSQLVGLLVGLRAEDQHRLLVWAITRPMRQARRRAELHALPPVRS